ncbi:MAG: hypothetical protein FWF78_06410 [Defluviitaleaceae bacterium]|nr:hypothetical protein [Defluviitaleaceae bacterium]
MSNFLGINTIPENQANWATTTREPSQDLDRQAFLNLLITQLRHQDPLNPMDDRDFIAQMAQFSALEQMVNLNATFERTQAFGMIGKIVDATFTCPTSGERVEIEGGLVTSVIRNGQSVLLAVQNGNRIVDVPFDAVTEVSEDFFLSHQLHEIFSQIQGQRAAELIGKYVQGFAMVGEDMEFVEGKVDFVNMQGDVAILVVGNQQLVFPRDVFSAASERRILDSPHFTHGDKVIGVDVVRRNDSHFLYLMFDNDSRINIQNISHVSDALTYVNRYITTGDIENGRVISITMRFGAPFLNVRVEDGDGGYEMRQIDFLGYIAERTGQEAPNNPAADGDDDD